MPNIDPSVAAIVATRARVARERSALVAVSGVDGAGKGFVTARIASELEKRGSRVATINADAWLNLPHVRFGGSDPAEHFYRHAVRFEHMFAQLVLPLRETRSIELEFDDATEPAKEYHRQRCAFRNIDVILLEGIYLLKPAFLANYDLKIWIETSFPKALERAIARGQEGLPPDETRHAFETIFFPAQRLHFARDRPREIADLVIDNDA